MFNHVQVKLENNTASSVLTVISPYFHSADCTTPLKKSAENVKPTESLMLLCWTITKTHIVFLHRHQTRQRLHHSHWSGETGRPGLGTLLQLQNNRGSFSRWDLLPLHTYSSVSFLSALERAFNYSVSPGCVSLGLVASRTMCPL